MRTARYHKQIYSDAANRVAREIRAARQALGLRCQDAAEPISMDRAQWSAIESGYRMSPHFNTLHAMAGAVGLRLVATRFTEEEEAAMRGLVRWYAETGLNMPPALRSALAKIQEGAPVATSDPVRRRKGVAR